VIVGRCERFLAVPQPKLQALVYDILPSFGGRCRKAMLGVCTAMTDCALLSNSEMARLVDLVLKPRNPVENTSHAYYDLIL